jgi:hypothetical protein
VGSHSILDSPSSITGGMWSVMPHSDKTIPTSSVSSINMESDSSSVTSSDDDAMDRDMEDPLLTTPQVSKLSGNFISGAGSSPGGDWMGNQSSPAASSLMSFQRARLRKDRSRQSSSSGNSSKPSPIPLSPPLMKSIELVGSHSQRSLTRQQVQSRRESLSLGTGELQLSDSGDEDGKVSDGKDGSGNTTSASSTHSPRGVIRRPVTRRSNLLPKTKTFARIRAALIEESAPVENEAKREADVIHQVRESEPTVTSPTRQSHPWSQSGLDSIVDDDMIADQGANLSRESTNNFSRHAQQNSDGAGFWDKFDHPARALPRSMVPKRSYSSMSDEICLESTSTSQTSHAGIGIFTGQSSTEPASRSRSSTPLAANAPTAGEAARKANNRKRGRDDDLDPSSFKRRAVSPGMSVQSSPVLPQSPGLSGDKVWGHPPWQKGGNERSNSGGPGGSSKRVGLQGMVETNDGLMNMSIE